MNWITKSVIAIGDYLMSLSDRARNTIVMMALLLLGGCGIYKLVSNVRKLQEPLPAATPDQLIKPMEGLIRQTSANVSDYRIERNRSRSKLDSLKTLLHQKPKTDR